MPELPLLTPLVDILKKDQGSDPTSLADFWKYVGNRSSFCLKEILRPVCERHIDRQRFGCIREAVKLDQREHVEGNTLLFCLFDSRGDTLAGDKIHSRTADHISALLSVVLHIKLTTKKNNNPPLCILCWC